MEAPSPSVRWIRGIWTPDGPDQPKFLAPTEARYDDVYCETFYYRANDEFITEAKRRYEPLPRSPATWCDLFGRASFDISRGRFDAHFIDHLAICVKPGLNYTCALWYFQVLGAVNRSMGGYPAGIFERALRIRNELEIANYRLPEPIGLPVMKAVSTTTDAAHQSANNRACLLSLPRILRRRILKMLLFGYERSIIVKDQPYPDMMELISARRTWWRSRGPPGPEIFTYKTSVAATRHGYRIEDLQLVCKQMKSELDQILVRDGYDLYRCIDFDCSPESAMAFFHDRSKNLDRASRIILHYRFRGDVDAASDPLRTPATTPVSPMGSWRALLNVFVHRLKRLRFIELWIGESFVDAIDFTSRTDAWTMFGTRKLFYREAYYQNYDPYADSDDEEASTLNQNIFQRVARVGGIVFDLKILVDTKRNFPPQTGNFQGELRKRIILDSRNRPLLHEYQPCSCTKTERLGGNLNIFRKTCKFFQEVPKPEREYDDFDYGFY